MTSFYEELNKSGKMSDEKENAQSRANVDKWIFRLLLLLIGVMPLIVLANVEQVVSPLISNIDTLSSGVKGDLFTHYKGLFVIVITIITGAMLLAKVFFMGGQIRKTPINYAIGLFAFAIIISTVFSPNITVALNGQYNRSDGAISWLCYLALMFIAMNIDYPKNVIKYVMYTMMPFVFINLFIITMNFYGKDLLQYGWMQKLVSMALPEGANISEGSTLVGTLNQWNYMSGMFAIMVVMYLTASIFEKSLLRAIGYLLVAVMSVAIMLMSLSTSGFLTFCVMMLVILFVALKSEKRVKKLVIVAVFLMFSALILHVLATKEDRVWNESIGFFIDANPYGWKSEASIEIPKEFSVFEVVYAAEKFELPDLPERGMSVGSGRAYIWSKTFNLLEERPLFGYGLDTLIYNFPHYNSDARAGLADENTITDKPHNMYVGWLYGTGAIGLLSVMILIALSLFKPLKVAIKNNDSIIWIMGVAWGAYLIQAVFNDSLPGTSAPMWVIAGIMLAITLKNKEQIDGRNN